MSRKLKTINVNIMEKEYPVACPPGQETTLMAAVDQVDRLMHTIKRNGRTVGVERIAVMAAINMAHELLSLKEKIALDKETETHSHNRAEHTKNESDTPENKTQENEAYNETTAAEAETKQQAEARQQIAKEEAAIAAQLQALTEKLEATLNDSEDSPQSNTTPIAQSEPETEATDTSGEIETFNKPEHTQEESAEITDSKPEQSAQD